MRSPAEYFCKYLLSTRKYSLEEVKSTLEKYGFEGVSIPYLKSLQEQMEPRPTPWGLKSTAVKSYLRSHGIHDLWFPNAAVKEAYDILAQPSIRSKVEQLLLSPLRVEEIVVRLNKHYSIKLTVEGVQAFGHYFWNKSLLSTQEWINYLESRPASSETISILRASPDMAQTLVPWLANMSPMPGNLSTGQVARRMRDLAFLKVLETEHHPATLAHSKMMKNYMDVIRAAEEQMRQSDVALKDVLAAFEQFRLRKDEGEVPSIDDATKGNYSRSGSGTGSDKSLLEKFDEEMEDDRGR